MENNEKVTSLDESQIRFQLTVTADSDSSCCTSTTRGRRRFRKRTSKGSQSPVNQKIYNFQTLRAIEKDGDIGSVSSLSSCSQNTDSNEDTDSECDELRLKQGKVALEGASVIVSTRRSEQR